MGEGFTAFSCGSEPAKAGQLVDPGAGSGAKVWLHAERRQGRPRRSSKDSASCRDQHCGRRRSRWRASAIERRSEPRPDCRSCRRKPIADCNSLETAVAMNLVLQRWSTRAAARKGRSCPGRLRKRSVVPGDPLVIRRAARAEAGFAGVGPAELIPDTGRERRPTTAASPELSPGLPGSSHQGRSCSASPPMTEASGASRVWRSRGRSPID